MEFDWVKSVDHYGEQLCDIAFRLLSMAGIRAGRTVETLPRGVYLRILAILRPAEFAARRLIAMAAAKAVTITVLRTKARETRPPDTAVGPSSSVILGPEPRTHSVNSATSSKTETQPYVFPFNGTLRIPETDHLASPNPDPQRKPRHAAADTARGDTPPVFALFDPFKHFGPPWREPGDPAPPAAPERPPLPPGQPVDARSITRRIRALANALMKLEYQAIRLACWRARREAGQNVKPIRFSPMRPGRPPGYRRKPKTDIECLLKDLGFLARDAWDTS